MPLLHGKPFMRQKTPVDLRLEDGFECKATREVFRTYDEFVERTILCNSEVWSCSLTKKPGLTYQEAVDSERRARENLQSFPAALVGPLLHLASLTQRSHLNELCEDVYNFAKKRYFPGEIVDVTGHNGAKWLCEILEVQPASSCCNSLASLTTVANGNGRQPADGDAVAISNRDESTPCLHVNRKNMEFLSPALFRYIVKLVKADDSSPFVTEGKQIKRKKNLSLSKEILKLLLKQHCEKHGGIMRLKPSTVSKFGLSDQTSQFFPDEPLHFPCSSQAKEHSLAAPAKKDNTMSSAKKPLEAKMMSFVNNKHKVKRAKVGVQEARMSEDKGNEECQMEGIKRWFEEYKPRKEWVNRMKLEEMEQEKMMEKIPSVSKFGLSDLVLSSAGPAKKDNTMSSAKMRDSTMSSAKKRDDTMSSAKQRERMELKAKQTNKKHKVKREKVDVQEARMSEKDKGKEYQREGLQRRFEEQEIIELEKEVQLNTLKEQRFVSLAKMPSALEKQRKKEGKEECLRKGLKRRFEEEKPRKNHGMKRMKLEETEQHQSMEMVPSVNKKRKKKERIKPVKEMERRTMSLTSEKPKEEQQEIIKLEEEVQLNTLKEQRFVSLAKMPSAVEKQRKKEKKERMKDKGKGKEECQGEGLKRWFEEDKPRKKEGVNRMKLEEMEQEKMMEKIPSVSTFGLSDLVLSSAGPAKKDNTMSSAKRRDSTMSSAKKRERMELKAKQTNKKHKVKREKVDVQEARMSEKDKGKEYQREGLKRIIELEKEVQLNMLKEQWFVSLAKMPSALEKQRKKEKKERMKDKGKETEECPRKGLKRLFEEEKPRKNHGIKRMKLEETEQHQSMEMVPSVNKKRKKKERIKLVKEMERKTMSLTSEKPKKEQQEISKLEKEVQLKTLKEQRFVSLAMMPSALEKQRKKEKKERMKDKGKDECQREGLQMRFEGEKPRKNEGIKRMKLEETKQGQLVEMVSSVNKKRKVMKKPMSLANERPKEERKIIKLEKDMERKQLKEEEKERKEEEMKSLANEKQRKKEEQERIKLEKEILRNKLKEERLVSLANEKQRKKEEQERLKLEKEMERKRSKEEQEIMKVEKEMERKRLKEEEMARKKEVLELMKVEKEMDRKRLKEEEMARKKEVLELMKVEKEMERRRLKEEEMARRKDVLELMKVEKEMERRRLKEEEMARKKEVLELMKVEKEMERKRLKEEEMVRKKEEWEKLKAEKLMSLANEKQRKKEEQERIKLEKEIERKRLKEDEKERKKEDQELMKMEKEMERNKLKENVMSKHHVRTEKEDLQDAMGREKEELRRRLEEEKQRKKEEKEMERDKLREEKKRHTEQIKLWSKPREDMECDDLKELPCPVPVRTRVPAELFGDALMVLEFLCTFEEFFNLKDEFPDGVTLEVLEEALVGSNPEGPLCELLKFFLSSIFQAQTEELEDAQAVELQEARKTKPTNSAISTVASLTAAWSQLHQGCNIKKLELNSCTVSEILRLHILSSGADCDHGNAMFRYLKQGGFASTDDPCVELRTANPALLERLARTVVYDLTPGEKLNILQALCGKLLTLVKTRKFIEENTDKQRIAKQEMRQIRAEQHRRDREAAQKLREQAELRKEELKEKLRDGNGNEHPESLSEHSTEDEDQYNSNHKADGSDEEPHQVVSSTSAPVSLTAEELEEEQRKVKELQDRVQKASRHTSLVPLGRDRFYRRYWLVPSACALFVEDDYFGLTEDMLEPHPAYTSQDGQTEDEGQQDTQVDTHSSTSIPAGGLPVSRPNRWAFYSSVEEVKQLTEALNPRGHRESSLKELLQREKDQLTQTLNNTAAGRYNYTAKAPESFAPAESFVESRLRNMLLGIEGRIYEGNLGALKVTERETWRSALERGQCELPSASGRKNGKTKQEEETEVDDSQPVSSAVRCLRHALFQIEQGTERRFLQAPLGSESKSKDDKKNGPNGKKSDSDSDNGISASGQMVLERWRESLQSCSSLSQVFVHLSTFDRSITWAKSLLNTRCKLCRRKGDAETMLLCDGCDRGHHMQCLRPRLRSVPDGEWFCPDCRPKQRAVPPVFSRKRTFEEDDESEEESESEESEESDEEESSEDEEPKRSRKRSVAVKLPPAKRGPKGQPKVSSRNGSAARKNSSASRSSGKRATPPSASSKRTPVSKGRPAPCAGRVRTTSTPASTPRDSQKRAATVGSLSRKSPAKRSRI